MNTLKRLYRHLWDGDREARRCFPRSVLDHVEAAVDESEKHHRGELCVVVEGGLGWAARSPVASRLRAEQVFAQLGVWDTADDSGVLVYVLMAEHKLEILADRGINAKVSPDTWLAITQAATARFKSGEYEAGLMGAIDAISTLLIQHFPAGDENANELPNVPVRM